MKCIKQILLVVILILVSFLDVEAKCAVSQFVSKPDTTINIIFNFKVEKADLDHRYMSNQTSFDKLRRVISNKEMRLRTDSIVITTTSSPDGSEAFNNRLSKLRSQTLKSFILKQYPFVIERHKIKVHSVGEDWKGMHRLISADSNIPYKKEVLAIMKQKIGDDMKERRIRQIAGGTAWKYISRHYLNHLRQGVVSVLLYQKKCAEPVAKVDTVKQEVVQTPQPVVQTADTTTAALLPDMGYVRKPFIALKTNLLFDAASALNVEIEVPIGKRWSIAGEWIFPWWSKYSKQFYFQCLSGNIEGRYWLGNRDKKAPLTGWFAGLFSGGGYYDFMLNKNHGYQGEFYIMGGLSAGYAHTINKSGSLRMEYSLGVGYLRTNYRKYVWDGYDYMLVAHSPQSWNYTWIGPVRAKVSLVWMLYHNVKKGGKK